jgi:hypothetical protein
MRERNAPARIRCGLGHVDPAPEKGAFDARKAQFQLGRERDHESAIGFGIVIPVFAVRVEGDVRAHERAQPGGQSRIGRCLDRAGEVAREARVIDERAADQRVRIRTEKRRPLITRVTKAPARLGKACLATQPKTITALQNSSPYSSAPNGARRPAAGMIASSL